ncbi:MAG: DUF1566 domain-containing protein, partial [Candidatus Electrothrix sp. AUS1_2]|nr:DUF1566 domain-containing protein [Candidatus Electrothrix sp. AUS1_2]
PSYEILPKLNSMLSAVSRDDLVLVYYSGHGKLNRLGHLCLAVSNTAFPSLEATSIPAATIKSYFDLSDTRKRILILDCCYSGAAGAEFVKGGVDDQLQLMSGGQGTFIMTASTAFQTAVEKEGDSNGLFTKHLLEGIRSGEADRDKDGLISVEELYEYVHEKVQAEGAQVPMKWGLQTKGSMVIAKSGRDVKEKRRQELRAMLYKLAAQGLLSDGIVSAAVHVISLPENEMTAKDRECLLLIERFADERISTGDFVESWGKTCLPPEHSPLLPPKSKLLLLILAAVSCVAAGTGWYFRDRITSELPSPPAMGTVSVSSRTLPSLSQIKLQPLSPLPPPPKMDKVSVSSRTVPSLPQIKPQPLPKVEKMPPKERKIGQYIDHGDGTITDTKTVLMWKRCAEGLSGDNCEEGEVEKYTWNDAVQSFKNVVYAGYTDWRLPTIDELKTLVYCSEGVSDKESGCCNYCGCPESRTMAINQQAFPNTEESFCWSGSPYADNLSLAWSVFFSYGCSVVIGRDNLHAVRLLRGGL